MATATTNLGKAGRLVIPAAMRDAMGIETGDTLLLRLDGSGLHVTTPRQAFEKIQQAVRKYVPEGRRASEELIAERRKEAERE